MTMKEVYSNCIRVEPNRLSIKSFHEALKGLTPAILKASDDKIGTIYSQVKTGPYFCHVHFRNGTAPLDAVSHLQQLVDKSPHKGKMRIRGAQSRTN